MDFWCRQNAFLIQLSFYEWSFGPSWPTLNWKCRSSMRLLFESIEIMLFEVNQFIGL